MLAVGLVVRREGAVPPADEQPDGEEDDERRDGGLGALLHPLGQVALGDQDRDAEHDERDRVAGAPPDPEPRGRPSGPLAPGGDERA